MLVLILVLVAAIAAVGYAASDDSAEPADDGSSTDEPPPVVALVLDEFPADALLTPDGEIDAARFPNFAALARTSTWFRNGHTVYDSTFKAVPAILDARMPRRGTAPDVRSHQPSVFHLMHRHGYDVVKVESGTAVCPPWICAGTRTRRPGVLKRLAGGGRPARLHAGSAPSAGETAADVLLPPRAAARTSRGSTCRRATRAGRTGKDPIGGHQPPIGFHDPRLTDHNHLRHLLQVGYVDRELGLVMRRLRRTELFDQALLDGRRRPRLLVRGGRARAPPGDRARTSTRSPRCPFFVKTPGQSRGRGRRQPGAQHRPRADARRRARRQGLVAPDGHSAFAAR